MAVEEGPLERFAHGLDDDEALAGDAALAGIDHAGGGADLRGLADIGVLEDEVGVRAAELEHAFLEHRARRRGHLPPGLDAAGQGHRRDGRILDQRLHVAARDEHGPEQVLGKARLAEHRFDGERRAGHVAGVLEHGAVAGHERRRGEAEDLPEREVPRHHREHDAERVVGDEGLRPAEVDRLAGEVFFCRIGEVVAVGGAFFHFGAAILEGLAHLGRHDLGELALPAAQHGGGPLHELAALGEGRAAPILEGAAHVARDGERLVARMPLVAAPGPAGRRVMGGQARLRARPVRGLAGVRLVALRRSGGLVHQNLLALTKAASRSFAEIRRAMIRDNGKAQGSLAPCRVAHATLLIPERPQGGAGEPGTHDRVLRTDGCSAPS